MRRVFAVSTSVLTLVTTAQFFLAGMGAFDSAPNAEAFGAHRGVGYMIMFAAVGVTAVGAVVRAPRRLVAMVGLSAVLVLLQAVIVTAAKTVERSSITTDSMTGEVVFGLHAINALLIIAILAAVSRRAWHLAGRGPDPDARINL